MINKAKIVEQVLNKVYPQEFAGAYRQQVEQSLDKAGYFDLLETANRFFRTLEQIAGWYIEPESMKDIMFQPSKYECHELWKLYNQFYKAMRKAGVEIE